jgi:hypothetical protein
MRKFEYIHDNFYSVKSVKIYLIHDDGSKEMYIENGSPVKYSYGLWGDMIQAGTKNPELQAMIEQAILYYRLIKEQQ